MEALNKNKEEIEKILNTIKYWEDLVKKRNSEFNYTMETEALHGSKRARQERIKTSILWCEDEIKKLELKYKWTNEIRNRINYFYLQTDKTLKFPDGQIHQLCKMMMDLDDKIEFEIKQLQTHLTWLKEQEKKQ